MRVILKGHTSVYEDSYEHGELDHVDCFSFDSREFEIVDESHILNAMEIYYKFLGYSFNSAHGEWIEPNIYSYYVLVDEDNGEASNSEIESWKKEEMKLYSSLITVNVAIVSEFKAY